jgi:hypothetical protein
MGPRDLTDRCEGVPLPGSARIAEGPHAGQPADLGRQTHHPIEATCLCGGMIRRDNVLPGVSGGDWRHLPEGVR